jgi:hypothetical protein
LFIGGRKATSKVALDCFKKLGEKGKYETSTFTLDKGYKKDYAND